MINIVKLDLEVEIETAVIDQFCKKANASLLQTYLGKFLICAL